MRLAVLAISCSRLAAQLPGDALGYTLISPPVGTSDSHFGAAAAVLADLSGDGVDDLAVGQPDGFSLPGSVWVFHMHASGTWLGAVRMPSPTSGFPGTLLATNDRFGASVASLGDLDGDGVSDLAVGAPNTDEFSSAGSVQTGAVWILFLKPDGTVKAWQEIGELDGGLGGADIVGSRFGSAVAGIGDLDGDGVVDLAVGAERNNEAPYPTYQGALWILFLRPDGTVKSAAKTDAVTGGMAGLLDDGVLFGASVVALGDLDGDGVQDLLVGAPTEHDEGSAWVLFLQPNGDIKSVQKIDEGLSGFEGHIDDLFGCSVELLGDLDGDGAPEVAVGECTSVTPAARVWIVFLRPDGTVKDERILQAAPGTGFPTLTGKDGFGVALARFPDLNGDGKADLVVGAQSLAAFGDFGAVVTFFLEQLALLAPYGCSSPQGSLVHLSGHATPGSLIVLGVDNPLGSQPGALPFVALAGAPDPGFPCGTLVPGLGMAGPGALGELLISIAGGNPFAITSGSPWSTPGSPSAVPVLVPDVPSLAGGALYAQGLLFDPAGSLAFALTNALKITVMP